MIYGDPEKLMGGGVKFRVFFYYYFYEMGLCNC